MTYSKLQLKLSCNPVLPESTNNGESVGLAHACSCPPALQWYQRELEFDKSTNINLFGKCITANSNIFSRQLNRDKLNFEAACNQQSPDLEHNRALFKHYKPCLILLDHTKLNRTNDFYDYRCIDFKYLLDTNRCKFMKTKDKMRAQFTDHTNNIIRNKRSVDIEIDPSTILNSISDLSLIHI